jgi:hypothetical protein
VRHIFAGDVRYTGTKVQVLQDEEQQVAFYYLIGLLAAVNCSEISVDAGMQSRIDRIHKSQHIIYLTG